MGRNTFSREAYRRASDIHVPKSGPATRRAEQTAHATGKLHPLVDPAGFDVIRRSLLRFEQRPDNLWVVTIGLPVPIETRVDTTGSMGGNVDIALRVLPRAYGLCSDVLPGCDVHMATGIFGDITDQFVLCRPQFEMIAEKLVEQLTLMVPEREGGDIPEDPHYGLFGAAYLTAAYINRIGLKRYDFTVSDAPARNLLGADQLMRIFGADVFNKVAENGHRINQNDLPTTREVIKDLLKEAHAFFLQVGTALETTKFWTNVFGADRVIMLPSTEVLPQVQAVIIGLTEGTLALSDVVDFLRKNNVSDVAARAIARSASNIPVGAQAALPNYSRRPKAGDVFEEKTDLWPIKPDDVPSTESDSLPAKPSRPTGPNWL